MAQRPAGGIAVESNTAPWAASTSVKQVPASLLENRRPVVILPSEPSEPGEFETQRTVGAVAKLAPEQRRLPEGFIIGGRPARIELGGRWPMVHLEPQPGMFTPPPLRLLPNQYQAIIESVLAESQPPPRFMLTGRVTEFQGINYLLAENVAVLAAAPPPPPPKPAVASTGVVAAQQPVEKPVTAPPDVSAPTGEPTAQDVLQALMESEPLRGVLPSREESVAAEPKVTEPTVDEPTADTNQPVVLRPTPGSAAGRLWSEGALVVDQVGRFVQVDEQWWSLAFEDRGKATVRPPIRLLPNRLLEAAIAGSDAGPEGGVFLVSGEVTTYRGINYLLLRKVLMRRDMGNLR